MKHFFVLFAFLLVFSTAFADVDTFEGQTGTDTWEGSSSIDTREGQTVATASSFDFVSYDSVTSASSTTAAVSAPSGTQDNDIMLVLIIRNNSETPTDDLTAEGFTEIGNHTKFSSFRVELWRKVASSESGSYSVTYSTSVRTSMWIASYRGGYSTSDPIDTSSNVEYSTDDTTLEAATVTVSANNSPLILVGAAYLTSALTCTAPASPGTFDEDVDAYDATSDHLPVFYSQVVNSGATGDMDATLSSSVNAYKHMFAVVLNP